MNGTWWADLIAVGVAVYACTERWPHLFYRWWVYRSDDGGETWKATFIMRRPDQGWCNVEIHPLSRSLHYKTVRRNRWAKP